MSVTIHWRMLDDAGKHFEKGTSSDLEKLVKVFGGLLDKEDVAKLRAMEVASGSAFFGEVADTVEQVGSIKFWGVW